MGARRCGHCKHDDGLYICWPNTEEYETCPLCLNATTDRADKEPLTESEANHVRFDWHYRQREKLLREAESEAAKAFADQMVELVGPLDPIGLDEAA